MGWICPSIPKLQRCNRCHLQMDKQFHLTHHNKCNYLSMLGLKLIHVCKRRPRILVICFPEYSNMTSGRRANLFQNYSSPKWIFWTNDNLQHFSLTYRGRETHICVSKLGHHWFRYALVTSSAPSHYMNQCWNIVNCTLGNIFQWHLNQNTTIFVTENAFENIVRKMSTIFLVPASMYKVGIRTDYLYIIVAMDSRFFKFLYFVFTKLPLNLIYKTFQSNASAEMIHCIRKRFMNNPM